MHTPYDENGDEIDAKYSIEIVRDGFDLIIESQGGSTGGRPPRNTGYARALVLHLRRMAELGMILDDLQVASTEAMKRPEKERKIRPDGYTLPLELAAASDFEKFRLAIGRASAAFGRKKDSGGNPTKKLRLRMRWSDASTMSANSIAIMLANSVSTEKPTADRKELAERVERARKRIRGRKAAPPRGQDTVPRTSTISDRYIRDPEVIAWVLEEAAGKCEHCRCPAPFKRVDGEPFLEVHHVRPLGEGGPDTTENAAACCPNCHRRLHFDPAKESLRLKLIASVKRLKDFPHKA
ncbi:HNH endonuclease [Cereibacter sphaeroides]|uniref:HNH endonuclease n=1 Tax=Cereibacter sphaeroides TaxID=1063 RepID=UPI001F324C65|nr:HNH endonuclease signature motif containing protein [Cereibacter sphaeroides]MCE6949601.1 HNH endonuclease [Cereibacter sphaeroides]